MKRHNRDRDEDQLVQDLREDLREVKDSDRIGAAAPVFEPVTDEEGEQEP